MKVNIEDLSRKVALMLGENPADMIADYETATLAERIKLEIEANAARAIRQTPRELISGWRMLDGSKISTMEDGSVLLPLPDDFLMLFTLRLEGWRRGVNDYCLPGSLEARLQESSCKGIRGTPQRPVAVLTATSEGNALRLFGPHSDPPKTTEAWFMPMPKTDSAGCLELPEAAIPILLKLAADALSAG